MQETEIELKFQIPVERRAALWKALHRGDTEAELPELTELRAHYFDTPDGLLARNRVALRLRREGPLWVQTLKASSGGNSAVRLEHNAPVAEASGDATPSLDLRRHAGSEAFEALSKALGADGAELLGAVYGTEIQRHTRLLHGAGGLLVEAAFDEGRIVAGAASHAVSEIEFELKAGPASGLFELAAEWAAQHGLWLDTVTKSERGHLLARGQAHPAARKARPPLGVDAKTGPQEFARACVQACLAQVLPNASAIAAGSEAAEHVHQLRVGLRRLRTVLGEMAAFDCGLDPGWEPPLSALFGALGEARDRHLLHAGIGKALLKAGSPPLPEPSAEPPPSAPSSGSLATLLQAVETQQVLLAALAFACGASPAAGPACEGSPLELLGTRLDDLQRGLRRAAKRFTALPVEDQHRARKRLKRLRYLAEFLASLFGAKQVRPYLDALRPAQNALGQRNDEAVALEFFRGQMRSPEALGASFATGWLLAREPASAAAAAKALKRAGEANGFWRAKPRKPQ